MTFPTVSLISTGGTIDKIYGMGAGVRDLTIGQSYASRAIRERLGKHEVITHIAEIYKDSLDITNEDRTVIIEACKRATTFKIIITHGTDTMIETAGAINRSGAAEQKTIVLTGALQPACMKESDADFNLGLAYGACLFLPCGVYIAMNGIHRWDLCKKNPDTGKFITKHW